ncbi:WS/DGAT domain-containing protein [Streptomyces specialis]|uniref:hypothetical protein n=1 Tax=Streptomyces specialis TaxID=498367 RepID=UPI00073F4BFB|nr:hypothetical protein [Streptomyces specialis]
MQRAALRTVPLLPALVVRCLLHPRRTALLTTNVRLGDGITVNGDPVRRAVALPPLLFGNPLTVALTTYGSESAVAFTSDLTDPDPALLPALWEEALAELEKTYGM